MMRYFALHRDYNAQSSRNYTTCTEWQGTARTIGLHELSNDTAMSCITKPSAIQAYRQHRLTIKVKRWQCQKITKKNTAKPWYYFMAIWNKGQNTMKASKLQRNTAKILDLFSKVKAHSLRPDMYVIFKDHNLPWGGTHTNWAISSPLGEYNMHNIQACKQLEPLRHDFRPPGAPHCHVDRGSMELEVYLALLHITGCRNCTPELLILSPMPNSLSRMSPPLLSPFQAFSSELAAVTKQHATKLVFAAVWNIDKRYIMWHEIMIIGCNEALQIQSYLYKRTSAWIYWCSWPLNMPIKLKPLFKLIWRGLYLGVLLCPIHFHVLSQLKIYLNFVMK